METIERAKKLWRERASPNENSKNEVQRGSKLCSFNSFLEKHHLIGIHYPATKTTLQCIQTILFGTELTVTTQQYWYCINFLVRSSSSLFHHGLLLRFWLLRRLGGAATGMALGRNPGTHSAVRMRQRRSSMR